MESLDSQRAKYEESLFQLVPHGWGLHHIAEVIPFASEVWNACSVEDAAMFRNIDKVPVSCYQKCAELTLYLHSHFVHQTKVFFPTYLILTKSF